MLENLLLRVFEVGADAPATSDVFVLKVAGMYTFCKELVEVELRSLGMGVVRELPQAYTVARNDHMTIHLCG